MTDLAGPLPTFFVIGAQKSGTTTLHRHLQGHPELFMCDPKEPQYFAAQGEWAKGERWYRSLFAGAEHAREIGEASTTYSMYPHYDHVVDRLLAVVPVPKLIYLVRDPVERMRSAYQHGLAGGTETRPLEVALRVDPRYLLTTSYAMQLDQWLARVSREQILLLGFEELRTNPAGLIERVLQFLGVEASWQPPTLGTPYNDSTDKRAPRAWWRGTGELIRRRGMQEAIPHWMVRLNESERDLARRPISPTEVTVPAWLDAELRGALSADSGRLAGLWQGDSLPYWLEAYA